MCFRVELISSPMMLWFSYLLDMPPVLWKLEWCKETGDFVYKPVYENVNILIPKLKIIEEKSKKS